MRTTQYSQKQIFSVPNSTENQTEFVFEYFIKDYTSTRSSYTQWPPLSTGLGNVRAVITEENATFEDKFLATMETRDSNALWHSKQGVRTQCVYASIEENNFENVELTREDLPTGYPIDASVEFNERIARLTAANGTEMGPSIVMPVKNGEKVSLSASYFYEENAPGQTYDNLGLLVNEVLLALASSGAGILPLNESQLGILAIGGEGYGSDIYNLLASNIDTTNMDRPHAYLVYVYYDQQMNILPAISGAIRVQNPNQLETILRSEMQAQRNGYLHAYVSNGGTAPVHFDNMMVSLIQGKVRQFNDYYPYGLSISGVNGVNGSYKNMYTSKELQNGEFASGRGLEMYDFHARLYDPQLGRWFVPDPAEQFHNPYLAMGNTPVNGYDPNGELFLIDDLIVTGIAMVGGYVYSGLTTQEWGWESVKTGLIWGGTAFLALNTGGLSYAPGAAAQFGGQFVASQVVGSFFPSINVPINDNLSVGISPAVFFGGGQTGSGINGNVNYSSGNFSASVGFGARSFSKNFGPSGFQQEFTSSWGAGWDDGKSGFGLYSTKFNSGSRSQRVGGVSVSTTVGGERLGFRYENDGAPFAFLGRGYNDGEDRYRTAAGQLSYGDFNIKMNLYTGDARSGSSSPDDISKKYPHSFYRGGDVNSYRWGGLTAGYGNYNFGINSERVRHGFQNRLAHDILKPQPAFEMMGRSIESVFQYRIGSPYTLW